MGQTTNQQIETIYAENFARKYEKKILVTSDAWSMRRPSHRPSDPGYHIEDCRISVVFHANRTPFKCGRSNA